jgi:hypothetical protein
MDDEVFMRLISSKGNAYDFGTISSHRAIADIGN